MDFGTITLDAKASDTIDNVKRNLRKKLESMFEGYDVELWVGASRAFNFIFDGNQLEDDKTLSEYNILRDATLRFVYGLEGGGKRARTSSVAVSSADMVAKDTDPDEVKQCLSYKAVGIKQWVMRQSSSDRKAFYEIVKDYRGNPERIPNYMLALIPETVALEAAEMEMKKRFKAARDKMCEEWLNSIKKALYNEKKEQYKMTEFVNFIKSIIEAADEAEADENIALALNGLRVG
eukprot:UN2138